uniref:NADP-dependent oxidoreductase domain-containing protein n=1 Tax=Mycena chlorophos TaxID=658473 RepID=A0ABQ0KTZ1_MYCCL|nr:predicted protein [Mycena chlorophos]
MPFEDILLSDGQKVRLRVRMLGYLEAEWRPQIPAIAFGTGSIYKWTDVTHYVQQALEAGFSHIDTAQAYVGNAIQQSALARSDFYITTKYSRPNLSVDESIRNSLSQLGLKFVDLLYLIHQPTLSKDIVGTWVELEGVKKAGLAKSIGVSNFPLHPYNYAQQKPTVDWCQARGIVVEAYGGLSSLTKYPGGPVDTPVAAAARKLGISPTQVLMGWLRAKGVVIVTTTSNKGRLEEYLASGDLPPLPPSDVAAIDEAGAKGPPGAFERLLTHVIPNELVEGLRKVAKDRNEEEERDPELRQRRETMRKRARVAFVPLMLFLVGYLVYISSRPEELSVRVVHSFLSLPLVRHAHRPKPSTALQVAPRLECKSPDPPMEQLEWTLAPAAARTQRLRTRVLLRDCTQDLGLNLDDIENAHSLRFLRRTLDAHECSTEPSAGYINTNGMIRDQSANLDMNANRRRRAIGCDGITNCRTSTTGRSCDEIFYASTYSGGLGCYAADYLAIGGTMANLPPLGTHRCVDAVENSSHGGAVNRFYQRANVGNGGVFYFTFLIPASGCMNARSTYCRRIWPRRWNTVRWNCYIPAHSASALSFPRLWAGQSITSSDDESTESLEEEEDYGLAGNITVTPGPAPSLTDQVYQLSSGRFIWSPFQNNGTLALGDTIIVPGNDTNTEIEEEETVIAAGRMQDILNSAFPDCPT